MLALDAVLEVELVLEFEVDLAPNQFEVDPNRRPVGTPYLAIRFWRGRRRQGASNRTRRGCVGMWMVREANDV